MSNQLLGNVYVRIMDDVIENCQTTFEEDGVNQLTLEDLRSTWQKKLSELKVGSFPWDPPPVPQPMPNPTVPSNVPRPGQIPVPGGLLSANAAPSTGPPRIKTEPGHEAHAFQPNGMPSSYGNNVARERAAQNLQQKFGPAALGQITQLQSSGPQHQHALPPGNPQQPPQMTEQQRAAQAEYQRRQAAEHYQKLQQSQQRSVPTQAQTDGADEWDGYVAQRRLQASENPQVCAGIDMTIRQRVEQANRSLEGGGLMMPLSEQPTQSQVKACDEVGPRPNFKASIRSPKLSQLDGVDDDDEDSKTGVKDELFDEDDEDAINSDLDDPDENAIEEEQEEGRPNQIMLCTYDKVQRVKNKWKCTLRDGVLNTGGKEYVFTKANGEFEW